MAVSLSLMAPLVSQKVPNGVDVIIETNIDDTERIVIFRSECSVTCGVSQQISNLRQ